MANNKRLTNEELTEIRERVEAAKSYGHGVGRLALDDVPKMLSHIAQQEAEVERLRKELKEAEGRRIIREQGFSGVFEW